MTTFKIKPIYRYSLHGLFWIALIALLNSKLLGLDWGPFSHEEGTLFISLIYGMTINIFLFYFNAYYLIPKLLHKKRSRAFWIISLSILVGVSIVEFFADIFYWLSMVDVESPEVKNSSLGESNLSEMFIEILFWIGTIFLINSFYWSMAFLFRLPKDIVHNERKQQQLKQDKLMAELDFLKAQINPHFLFNGINSIYHLIGSDDENAKDVLLRFSDLLRYQLYECKGDLILLKKELNYIQNYISLEEVRKGEDAKITTEIPDENEKTLLNGLKIAPLLLTPFLENAFKYLSLFSERNDNRLFIKIQIAENELYFEVENTIDPSINKKKNVEASGIGLKNVKRRLAILYPQKHILDISNNGEVFNVNLKIKLS